MQRNSHRMLTLAVFACLPFSAFAQTSSPSNSNLWPVHRDVQLGFRISYPPDWTVVPLKGPNVRFSVSPPQGPGNCNVVAKPSPDLKGLSQASLNAEVEALSLDAPSWASYVGIPSSKVRVLQARRASIHDVPAILGVVETDLENLEGKFIRKQTVALTLTPGIIWSLNCGASSANAEAARAQYTKLAPSFAKIFGSFAFAR